MTITAAVSSMYPATRLATGIAMFGEQLTRRQLVGGAGIIAGLAMIGLT